MVPSYFPFLRHLLSGWAKLPKHEGTVWRGVKGDLSGGPSGVQAWLTFAFEVFKRTLAVLLLRHVLDKSWVRVELFWG